MTRPAPQYVSAYKGYPGIEELIIKSGGVQYRPVGCYGLGHRVFTLLIGAIEKNGKIPEGTRNKSLGFALLHLMTLGFNKVTPDCCRGLPFPFARCEFIR